MGGGSKVGGWRALFAAVLFWTAGAHAEEADAAAKEKPAVSEENTPDEAAGPGLVWSGRLFARATADERTDFARDFSIPTARIDLQATYGNVDAKLEADVASEGILKDAYIRLRDDSKRYRLQGGRFKAPFLARELESRWDLPLVDRGIVDDYLIERSGLGGRRLGLMAEGRFKSLLGLRTSVGLFQGAYNEELRRNLSEDAAARVTIRPWKFLQLGTSGYVGEVFDGGKRFAAGAEATVLWSGFRVSAEGLTGKLPVGAFRATTILASYGLPLDAAGRWILQPVGSGELLQLLGDNAGRGWSAVTGVNVVYDDRLKLMVQGERAFRPGDERPRNAASVQLAAQF